MYGPTTGDKVRLGDTNLYAEIEKDYAVYGDECVFGGGKVLRDGMGQASGYPASLCLDTVITNAIIIDYTGIYKADIGIKEGLIVCMGKAGNPDIMDGVNDNMIFGVINPLCFDILKYLTPVCELSKIFICFKFNHLPVNSSARCLIIC